jgi:hypothetical protein
MKQFSNTNLSNQWLFDNNQEEEQIQNQDGFKQLWPGMGAFKDSFVRLLYTRIQILHEKYQLFFRRVSNSDFHIVVRRVLKIEPDWFDSEYFDRRQAEVSRKSHL